MLEATVAGGLAEKVPLSTDDYTVSDISLEFNVVGDRVEYIFTVMLTSMCGCLDTVTPPLPSG